MASGPAHAKPARFVQVAVPAPLADPLTYRVPASMAGDVAEGVRVRVPLGERTVHGIVLGFTDEAPEDVEIRELLSTLDPAEAPALPDDLLRTLRWTGEYYIAPPGDVMRTALPAALNPRADQMLQITTAGRTAAGLPGAPDALVWLSRRPGGRARRSTLEQKIEKAAELREWRRADWVVEQEQASRARGAPVLRRLVCLSDEAMADPGAVIEALARAPAQRKAFEKARQIAPIPPAELARQAEVSSAAVAGLVKSGWLNQVDEALEVPALADPGFPTQRPHELSKDQVVATRRMGELLEKDAYAPVLLFGVTGSGKTEVYLRAARRCLDRGRPVLFLVPEIGLAPHFAQALSERFGDTVVVLHSGLTDRQRFDAWQRARDGKARVVVGARSALFAPLTRPGLIIVDEEHDQGYKQEESPRYHARDLALVRGRESDAVVIIGSATPSIEAWAQAKSDKFDLLTLPERVGPGALAEVEVVDMRDEFREAGEEALLSRRLVQELQATVGRGEQAMVLLNRRGYTRVVLCRACGEAIECKACSVAMTWHRVGARLRCHYCGAQRGRPETCPNCKSEHLGDVGAGTQQAEEVVRTAVPQARIARLDRDTVRSATRLADTLGRFSRHELDVLVGTQMIAKGHHFPRVTLVGVLNADASLRMPDFRAGERAFQLLTQVAGRAGRGDRPGKVIVQAYRPDHPAILHATTQDYEAFAARELPSRKILRYPPAAALANLIVRDKDQNRAFECAQQLAQAIRTAGEGHVAVLGPTAAPLARLREHWRIQILVRALKRRRLNMAIRAALAEIAGESQIMPRWLTIDIDPQQLL